MVGYSLLLALALFLLGGLALSYSAVLKGRGRVTEEQRLEAAQNKRIMNELMATEGWQRMVEVAKAQADGKKGQVLYQPTEAPLAQEYLKGEIHGIELFMSIPKAVLEESEGLLRLAKEQEEE